MIYVSGKYTDVSREAVKRNIHEAELVAQQVLLLTRRIPLIPHKLTSFWDEWGPLTEWSHSDWMEKYCLPLLDNCSAIIMVPGWEFSKGARIEFEYADERHIPIYFSVEDIPAKMAAGEAHFWEFTPGPTAF